MNTSSTNLNLPLTLQEITEIALGAVQIARYITLAVYVVVVYDWLLSLSVEWELILRARWTLIKTAYLLCRYLPLLLYPFHLWAWLGDHPPSRCLRLVGPLYGTMIAFQLTAQAVVVMRCYAFTGEKPIILAVLGVPFVAVAAVDFWVFGTQFISSADLQWLIGDSGCFADDNEAEVHRLRNAPAVRAGLVLIGGFLLDVLAMGLIVWRALRIRSTARGSLGRAFVAQSLGAFLVISTINLVAAIGFLQPQREYDTVTLPTVLISNVMACHIILDLRRKVNPTQTEVYRLQSRLVNEAIARMDVDSVPTGLSQDHAVP